MQRWMLWGCVIVSVGSSAFGEEWPRWRGVRGDGSYHGPPVAEDWPQTLRELWRVPVGGGFSGVTVSGDRVYTMDRQLEPVEVERVLCFDAKTGERVWSFEYPADYGSMAYGSGPRASVTIHDGKAYTLGAVGHAHCFDAATGKLLWSIDTAKAMNAERPQWGFAASPVIDGNKLLLHIGAKPAGCVVALDRHTGKELWRSGDDLAGYATPMLIDHAGVRRLIVWSPEHLMSLAPDTGEIHWKFAYPVRYGVSIASPIFHDGLLLVSSYWHGVRAVRLSQDPKRFELAWSTDELRLRGLMSQPLYREGHAYLIERKDGLVAFELATGRQAWAEKSVTQFRNNPQATLVALGDTDRALILNAEGQLILAQLTPTGYREIARRQLIDKTWAHPALAAGRLLARSDTHLVCVELPMGKTEN